MQGPHFVSAQLASLVPMVSINATPVWVPGSVPQPMVGATARRLAPRASAPASPPSSPDESAAASSVPSVGGVAPSASALVIASSPPVAPPAPDASGSAPAAPAVPAASGS